MRGGASLDGGLLTFYDTVPANGLGGIAWAGLFPPPLQLSIDALGNVDGMEFAVAPLTSAGFTVFGWPSTYDVALTFTFADGPLLTLTDTAAPFTTYTSGEDGEDYVPVVEWSPIPEPTSLALVGGALAIVGLLRRRRR